MGKTEQSIEQRFTAAESEIERRTKASRTMREDALNKARISRNEIAELDKQLEAAKREGDPAKYNALYQKRAAFLAFLEDNEQRLADPMSTAPTYKQEELTGFRRLADQFIKHEQLAAYRDCVEYADKMYRRTVVLENRFKRVNRFLHLIGIRSKYEDPAFIDWARAGTRGAAYERYSGHMGPEQAAATARNQEATKVMKAAQEAAKGKKPEPLKTNAANGIEHITIHRPTKKDSWQVG